MCNFNMLNISAVVESLGGKVTKEELDTMLMEVDDNNDGYLDYDGDRTTIFYANLIV